MMGRRRGGGGEGDAVEAVFAEARQNLGVASTSTGLLPGSVQTFEGENPSNDGGDSLLEEGGQKSRSKRRAGRGRRMGRPPGRLYFRGSLEAVNRALEAIANEAREGRLSPQQANACSNALNSVAANLRFEKRQQRTAEEEQFVEQLRDLFAKNVRLREILVERGIIPPGDAVGPKFDA
jgi:hypothetical protein